MPVTVYGVASALARNLEDSGDAKCQLGNRLPWAEVD